ncbi:helix-turn-helix transcriptional regulator [Spongisporangium articulatum]|uniref:Helix-turn-helix transcriptional regulator n=1 Tax=Spongisporangium articulatum TaxID=3362603 RepID=A0ABW8AKR8_9ACTN
MTKGYERGPDDDVPLTAGQAGGRAAPDEGSGEPPAQAGWHDIPEPWRAFLDAFPDSMIVVNPYRVPVFASEAVEGLSQYARAQLVGHDKIHMAPEYQPAAREAWRIASAGGRASFIGKAVDADGSDVWLDISLTRAPDPVNPGGVVYVTTVRPAEEQMKVSTALGAANSRFYALLDAIDLPVLVIDASMTIRLVSPGAERMFGRPSTSFVDRFLFDAMWIGHAPGQRVTGPDPELLARVRRGKKQDIVRLVETAQGPVTVRITMQQIRPVVDGDLMLVYQPLTSADALARDGLLETARAAAGLTPREGQVLDLLAQGSTVSAMGRELSLSVHTVRGIVQSLLTKLDSRNQVQALVEAVRRNLVSL